ncbi:hypothetical protein [Candidatus Ichthyocystis hellenicum]|uniref:hypothetical protein n=1 Tax=Candidatus Ichthyocystis hellenicum TaxID=1561003 RepID=UPI000B859A5E|nr:hypothetical protein [Candidatus Ichthyocystis hellenicum]
MNGVPVSRRGFMEEEEPLRSMSGHVVVFESRPGMITVLRSDLPSSDDSPPPPYSDAPPPYCALPPTYSEAIASQGGEPLTQVCFEPLTQLQSSNVEENRRRCPCRRNIFCERMVLSCILILLALFLSFFSAMIALNISHGNKSKP